jgi:hypothetical protein
MAMMQPRFQAQRSAGTVRRVIRQGDAFYCGMCRGRYTSFHEAFDCVRICWEELLSSNPVLERISTSSKTSLFRCRFCARDHKSRSAAAQCAEDCKKLFIARFTQEMESLSHELTYRDQSTLQRPLSKARRTVVVSALVVKPVFTPRKKSGESPEGAHKEDDKTKVDHQPSQKEAEPKASDEKKEETSSSVASVSSPSSNNDAAPSVSHDNDAAASEAPLTEGISGNTSVAPQGATSASEESTQSKKVAMDGTPAQTAEPLEPASDHVTADATDTGNVATSGESTTKAAAPEKKAAAETDGSADTPNETVETKNESPRTPPTESKTTKEATSKRYKASEKEAFTRSGAQYICSGCSKKYFTKDEVMQCFEAHGDPQGESKGAGT